MKIQDFECTYDNSVGVCSEVSSKLNLPFPEAYQQWELMAKLSRAMRDHEGTRFCELPFCHTLEGEALGGQVNYGDGNTGPRAKGYTCETLEDLLNLPDINCSSGRVSEVLKACSYLHSQGEKVVLMVSGPFNILNVLIDPMRLFKLMRKEPEAMAQVFSHLQKQIYTFVEAAKAAGVTMISYSDSSGGVNILGPKLAGEYTQNFTYPLLKRIEQTFSNQLLTLLCPKTALALIGTEHAVWEDIPVPRASRYSEAFGEMVGKTAFVGQMCVKNRDFTLETGVLKSLKLI